MEGIGNVVAVDNDSVIISSQGARHQYKIPKSNVEGYNGAEVFLDISVSNLHSFDVDNNEIPSPRKEEENDAYSSSAATSAAGEFARPVITKNEQGLDKKQQKTTSLTNKDEKKEQPIRSENTMKGSESVAISEIETSIKSDKTLIQDNNNIVPASSSSSLTNSVTIAPPREQEVTQPEKVTINSPNNIEFNPPPTSAENLSTAHETSGAGRTNGSRELTQNEHKELQYTSQEEKLDEEKKYLGTSLVPPFTISVALWQQSMLYCIDIFNQFAINAAKTTQYWFNALGNESFEVE